MDIVTQSRFVSLHLLCRCDGLSIQRGALQLVAAVDEVISNAPLRRLASLVEARLGDRGLLVAQALHVAARRCSSG